MEEELFKLLKDIIYNNKQITRDDIRNIIEIYTHYNNYDLNLIHFKRNKNPNEAFGGYIPLLNNIVMDYNAAIRSGDKSFLVNSKIYDLDKIDYRNFYLLWSLFHELTHSKQYNFMFNSELDKLIFGVGYMYIKNYNDLYKKYHDLVIIERDANIEGFNLCYNLFSKIIDSELIDFIQYLLLRYLITDYKKDKSFIAPFDRFSSLISDDDKYKDDLILLKDLLIKEYPNIDYNHLKYGLGININDFYYFNGLLCKAKNKSLDKNIDFKKLIKL